MLLDCLTGTYKYISFVFIRLSWTVLQVLTSYNYLLLLDLMLNLLCFPSFTPYSSSSPDSEVATWVGLRLQQIIYNYGDLT